MNTLTTHDTVQTLRRKYHLSGTGMHISPAGVLVNGCSVPGLWLLALARPDADVALTSGVGLSVSVPLTGERRATFRAAS